MALEINSEKIILVEGKDEINFFEAFLKKLEIEDVQIIEVGGKDKFPSEFPALLNTPGFSRVSTYVIVRDADSNVQSTLDSIKGLLSVNNQPVPDGHASYSSNNGIRSGIFIMPGNRDEGMLETLCIDAIKENPIYECVKQFIRCLTDSTSIENPRNLHKAKMHTFLSGQKKYIPSVGMAAKKGLFNFESECFNDLKQFLLSF